MKCLMHDEWDMWQFAKLKRFPPICKYCLKKPATFKEQLFLDGKVDFNP